MRTGRVNRTICLSIAVLCGLLPAPLLADLKPNPIAIHLNVGDVPATEGKPFSVTVTISNLLSREIPFIEPTHNNAAAILFPIYIYDRDSALNLLRIKDIQTKLDNLPDTLYFQRIQLKPLQSISYVMHYNALPQHTLRQFNRLAEIPLFAGEYGMRVAYNPYVTSLSHSVFTSEPEMFKTGEGFKPEFFPKDGIRSNFAIQRIMRARDSIITIDHKKYFIQFDENRQFYWYYVDSMGSGSSMNLVHMTSAPPDSVTVREEYYYTHLSYVYAEFIKRYSDGNLETYRRWVDTCPSELYEVTYYPNKQIASIAWRNPDNTIEKKEMDARGRIIREEFYEADHKHFVETKYVYDKNGNFKEKLKNRFQACLFIEL